MTASTDQDPTVTGRDQPAVSPRFALRAATGDQHARLDSAYSNFDLGREADYRIFLSSHAAAFLPTEAALLTAGAEGLVPGWSQRLRADALRQDLAALSQPIPALAQAPVFATEAAILGGLYVLEGSRLGGAVLVRAVAAGLPTAFLTPGNPADWRAFIALLDERLSSPGSLEVATKAALDVFNLFERSAQAHRGGHPP